MNAIKGQTKNDSFRKSEAMNRPKKEFIPTSLSDLNIDSISLGSNGDRHNNNSNGARFNNLDRSKATSSYNLASHPSSHNPNNRSSFSRASKMYGSQSNISTASSSVNNYSVNSPTASTADPWEQAWEDNNNAYRPPTYQPKPREHSINKPNQSFKHSHSAFDFKQSQTTSNRSMNHYVEDPFDDPWAGMIYYQLFYLISHALLHSILHPRPQDHLSPSSLSHSFGDGHVKGSTKDLFLYPTPYTFIKLQKC